MEPKRGGTTKEPQIVYEWRRAWFEMGAEERKKEEKREEEEEEEEKEEEE